MEKEKIENSDEIIEKKDLFSENKIVEVETEEKEDKLKQWVPKTKLGKEVLSGKFKTIEEIFDSGRKIMEPEIADFLLDLKVELLNIGQAKGKFGGGKRRAWRQTQKKTEEGNKVTFSVMAVVGNEDGYVGIGVGEASETLPAREKAIRKAKMNLIKVRRACSSFECNCSEKHTIPSKTWGKCSSYKIILIPAPQGTGLVAGEEVKKILRLAGIKDVYTRSFGNSRATINVANACIRALEKLNRLNLED